MSHEDISEMFQAESDKLEGQMGDAADKNLTVSQMVDLYYQVINVSSMATMLRQQLGSDGHKPLLGQIARAESAISERFNSKIHPMIQERLVVLVTESAKSLQSGAGTDTPGAYEKLRQIMSTLEFVKQYEKGLSG